MSDSRLCFSSSCTPGLPLSTLFPCLSFFHSFSMFHPTTCQASADILKPVIELPLFPLSPLPLSTSVFSLSTTTPSRPLPTSTSLFCLSTRDMDLFPIYDTPTSASSSSSSSSIPTLIPVSSSSSSTFPSYSSSLPSSQSPTATLQSTNTQTQSSSSSSGDGSLFRQRGSQAAQPDETGRVPPYVDFSQFYRLWASDNSDGQSTQGGLGPQ